MRGQAHYTFGEALKKPVGVLQPFLPPPGPVFDPAPGIAPRIRSFHSATQAVTFTSIICGDWTNI